MMVIRFTKATESQKKHPETPKYQFVEALQEICILKYFKKHEELVGVASSEQGFSVFKWAGE